MVAAAIARRVIFSMDPMQEFRTTDEPNWVPETAKVPLNLYRPQSAPALPTVGSSSSSSKKPPNTAPPKQWDRGKKPKPISPVKVYLNSRPLDKAAEILPDEVEAAQTFLTEGEIVAERAQMAQKAHQRDLAKALRERNKQLWKAAKLSTGLTGVREGEQPAEDNSAKSIIDLWAETAEGRTIARTTSEKLARRAEALAKQGSIASAGNTTPRVMDSVPSWWKIPPPHAEAAEAFDIRHKKRVTRAKLVGSVADDRFRSDAFHKRHAFRGEVFNVGSNRYITPHKLEAIKVIKGEKRVKKVKKVVEPPLDLNATIWAPRATWCDAKDFVDNTTVRQKRFALDWANAIEWLNLSKVICKADLDADGAVDEDGDGMPEEVEEVGATLWLYASRIFRLFTYYALLGDDIFDLSLNEWTQFVDDNELADKRSKFCKKRDLDRLFITVDTATDTYWRKKAKEIEELDKSGKLRDKSGKAISGKAMLAKAKSITKKGGLGRVEFTGALVHMAIMKYIQQGTYTDVSDAVTRLMTQDIKPNDRVDMNPDDFRRDHCYTRDVIFALTKYESSLRNIFAAVAAGKAGGGKADLMDQEEWMEFFDALDFIGDDLTMRDVTFAFVWSRMCVIDDSTDEGRARVSSLPFEGFLEGICRIACMKALPTEEEIKKAGHTNAGSYMEWLKIEDEEKHDDMIEERATPWGEIPTEQPVAKCVEHTIQMMIHAIEADSTGEDNLELNEKEVSNWVKSRFK